MIYSIIGFAQLNVYNNSSFQSIEKWAENYDLQFDLSELKSNRDKNYLISSYFLFNSIIQKFVSSLSKYKEDLIISSKTNSEAYYGYVKGTIKWGETIRTRLISGSLKTPIFICSSKYKDFDTVPNQLLKYLLIKLKILIEKTYNLNKLNEWETELLLFYKELIKILNLKVIKEIKTLSSITIGQLNYLKASNKNHYHELLQALVLYKAIYIDKIQEAIQLLFLDKVLIHQTDHKLYELFILFKLYMLCSSRCIKKEYRLIGKTSVNTPASVFYFLNGSLEVRFQTLPLGISNSTEYREIINNSFEPTAPSSNRCPDIFLTWKPNGLDPLNLIIEMKYSSNIEYYYDSVYKIFGYLYDFGTQLNAPTKALLVFDNNIISNHSNNISITTTHDFEHYLIKILIEMHII